MAGISTATFSMRSCRVGFSFRIPITVHTIRTHYRHNLFINSLHTVFVCCDWGRGGGGGGGGCSNMS